MKTKEFLDTLEDATGMFAKRRFRVTLSRMVTFQAEIEVEAESLGEAEKAADAVCDAVWDEMRRIEWGAAVDEEIEVHGVVELEEG